MSDFALTPADVQRLLADPSEGARASTAMKVADNLEKQNLTTEERKLAGDIIRILAKDTATLVRQAIADSMRNSRNLPADVAEILALDVESIALPVLQSSPVLSDSFLIKIIREQDATKQTAIATRPQLSGHVVTTLVEKGEESALAALTRNTGAALDENNISYLLERFPQSEIIVDGLAERPGVPPHILEYLVAEASAALRNKIQSRPDYQKQMEEVIIQGRERATLRVIGRGRSDQELEEVARQLLEAQRLTASLVLRTLCLGDLKLFEICLATAAKVPLKNARVLIHDQGAAGLNAIYARTGLAPNFLPAIRHALDVAHETDFDAKPDDLSRYRKRLIERILTDPRGMVPEDIEYLLDKLSDLEVSPAAA